MSNTNLPGLSKTHPMDAFGSFLHNPLANEFLPKQVNTTIYMMMLKISNGYDIYGDLKKLLVDFKKEMIGDSFIINNPKASSSCGCGLSFSV